VCDAITRRLHIQPNGIVDVETESGNLANAQCFTSLTLPSSSASVNNRRR